jgi:signal transduction histidine kinase
VVEDHGPGIPQEKLETLFKPVRGKEISPGNDAGLGLGLYVAKTIVDDHGSKIAVQSHAGEGSVLTVELPLFRN